MIIETAIIGGSGLYDLEGIQDVQSVDISTPYGQPSDSIMVGSLDGVNVLSFQDMEEDIKSILLRCHTGLTYMLLRHWGSSVSYR